MHPLQGGLTWIMSLLEGLLLVCWPLFFPSVLPVKVHCAEAAETSLSVETLCAPGELGKFICS